LFLQHLSYGKTDTLVLQAELTWARKAIATTEATHIGAVLAAETSASAAIHVKDAKDQVALAEVVEENSCGLSNAADTAR
jgi:hypothetical protein